MRDRFLKSTSYFDVWGNFKMRKQRGITLIALVVTIIILLILAGVAVATLTGDNGLLQKATVAKEENEKAKELELIELAVGVAKIAGEGTITKDNLENELKINFNDNTITIGEIEDGWSYNSYKIDKSGEVDKLLPKEYEQVEYIESSGTQWIDTGVKSADDLSLEIEYIPNSYFPDDAILGSRTNDHNCQILLSSYDNYSAGSYIRFGNGTWEKTNVGIGIIQLNTKHSIKLSKNNVYLDGIRVAGTKNSDFSDNGKNMSLFAFRNSTTGDIIAYSKCKIFKFVIEKSNQEIKNFIPCYTKTTVTDVNGNQCSAGTAGMYDTVNGQFYTNQGSGDDFIAGPEV